MTSSKPHKLWLAGAVFATLFAVLFLYRTGVFTDKTAGRGPADFSSAENFEGTNTWMNIFQNNRKIGFSHTLYTKTGPGYQYDETVFMKINTMGLIQDLALQTHGRLNADFSLAAFTVEISSGRFNFSARGSLSDDLLTLTVTSSGTEQETRLNLSEKIYLPSGILRAAVSGGLEPGNRLDVHVFDPIAMGRESIHLEVLEPEEILVMGRPQAAAKVSLKYKGATQLAWVNEQGEILKEQGMLGIVLEKTTREDALQGSPVQSSQDLTRIASIPLNGEIADPASLQQLRLEIDGVDDKVFRLHGGRQTYQPPVLTIRKENITASLNPAEPKTPAHVPDMYLKSEPLIQSDHPVIQKLAADITRDAGDNIQKVRRIIAWIQKHIRRQPVLSMPDALAVLENRVGDCNEHAVLFAALARACGIPTQIQAGVVYLKKRFYYHAWNAVYIGQWITLDALFDQFPADVTHIQFTRGGLQDQLDILGLIETIKIRIVNGT